MVHFGRESSRFLRANARWLASGFLLTLFSSFGQAFFIGLSSNDLRATFHLSGGAFGGLYMLAGFGRSSCRPWCSRRRWGLAFQACRSTEASRCQRRCCGCLRGARRPASCSLLPRGEFGFVAHERTARQNARLSS